MNLDTITHTDLFTLCQQVDDASVDMILCDLPYGVTANKWDAVIPVAPMWEAFKRVIKPKGAIVLTATQPFASRLIMSNEAWFKYDWMWVKSRHYDFINAKNKPMSKHESVLVFSNGTTANVSDNRMSYFPQGLFYNPKIVTNGKATFGEGRNIGARPSHKDVYQKEYEGYPSTVLQFENAQSTIHPTQKPIELWQYLIKTYTKAGEVVLDPCVGSGTTAVACHLLDRRYICGDTSAEYVAIAEKRVVNCDPLRDKQLSDGTKQKSLFA